jgi:hypothetical protein
MLHGWIRLRFGGRIAIEVALRNDFAVAKRENVATNAFIPVPGAKPITTTARTPVQSNGQFITRFKDAPDAISLRLQSLAA